MLLAIVFGLYVLFILSYVLVSFFIAYHLINYAINSHFSHMMVSVFLIVSIFLLISNLVLFFSVDWSTTIANFLPNNLNTF